MERPSDQDLQRLLNWVCPGRKPDIQWSVPTHALEDEIRWELRITFTDDDLTAESFRQIVQNYLSYRAACLEVSYGRVVFSLCNFNVTGHATFTRGRLECADHEGMGMSASAALHLQGIANPIKENSRSTFFHDEYYIEGRRHRSSHLPAVESRTHHATTTDEMIETSTNMQYWQEGQPIYGPRPWSISSDLTVISGDGGKLVTVIRGLDVKWMIEYQEGIVPSHPLRLQIDRVATITVPPKERKQCQVEWNPEVSTPNRIASREIKGLKLFWALRPGLTSWVSEKELFDELGISPTNIDWGGDRFFIKENDSFAFNCFLMSEIDRWTQKD